jgi:hypothetical protein
MTVSVTPASKRVKAEEVRVQLTTDDPSKLILNLDGTYIFLTRQDWRDLNNKVVEVITAHEIEQLDQLAEGHYEDD